MVEATGPSGAVAAFSVTATNTCQPNVPVTCLPPSGSTFPLSTNTVTCVAVDAFGVTNPAAFLVIVRSPDTAPPVLTGPTNPMVIALAGQCAAGVSFTVTATDDWDPAPVVTCVPPSGSSFPVGRTTVLCTAVDATGNSATYAFPVSVSPSRELGLPGETWTARATNRNWLCVASSADGTKLVAVVRNGQVYTSADSGVTWTPRLTDANRDWMSVASSADGTKLVAVLDGGPIYASTNSGVTWTARESNRGWYSVASSVDGNRLVAADAGTALGSGGQIYTSTSLVPLMVAPTLLGATNRVAEATGLSGTVATFSITATNTCQPNVPVICLPPSGSTFPLGVTLVTCVAVDAFGGVNSATFLMSVVVAVPPVLMCPTNLVVTAPPGQCEASATFTATATDNVDPTPVVTCVPPSGSSFPVGRTTVHCTAVDASGHSSTCSFTVSVSPASAAGPAGEIWTPHDSSRDWRCVASSADGTKLVAGIANGNGWGGRHRFTPRPTPGRLGHHAALAAWCLPSLRRRMAPS